MSKLTTPQCSPARRQFLQLSAALAAWPLLSSESMATEALVPHSSGAALPRTTTPPNACDSHLHIIDGRFPTTPGVKVLERATANDYRLLQQRIGTTRAVLVQPKPHGTNHDCLLDAITTLGAKRTRGIGVVRPEVSDAELRRLDAGGIKGLRFSVWNPADTVTTIDMIEPLAKRIHDLGWHAQLHMSGDQIADNAALINRLPCPVVIDHMGRLPLPQGTRHPAFDVIRGLMERGNCWLKLSGFYLNTQVGEPGYPDASEIARAWVKVAPDRLVWGSDWPHVTEPTHKPDDALLFDLLAQVTPNEAIRSRILVDNPAKLYGFMND